MELKKADIFYFEVIKTITIETIATIYPHYYPKGVVEFFLYHHNDSNIMCDLVAGKVYIALDEGIPFGTVTLDDNEINRLFVLPLHQKKGYGTAIMDFAEEILFQTYEKIQLHASLPGKAMYLKRGYQVIEYRKKEVAYGDWLCVDIMEKLK